MDARDGGRALRRPGLGAGGESARDPSLHRAPVGWIQAVGPGRGDRAPVGPPRRAPGRLRGARARRRRRGVPGRRAGEGRRAARHARHLGVVPARRLPGRRLRVGRRSGDRRPLRLPRRRSGWTRLGGHRSAHEDPAARRTLRRRRRHRVRAPERAPLTSAAPRTAPNREVSVSSTDAVVENRVVVLARLLRPDQWIKNGFVLTGLIFGRKLDDPAALLAAAAAFVAFCLAASAVYVLNDWLDRDADRAHPVKRARPLASGRLGGAAAVWVAGACMAAAAFCAAIAGPKVALILLAYGLLNVAYSLRLKHVVLLDVMCIALGFMLRILAGTWGIGIPPSGWLLLTGGFIAAFLGFAKRRAEWRDDAGAARGRRVLARYDAGMLDLLVGAAGIGSLLCYGLYTVSAAAHGAGWLLPTVPIVLFGLLRYLFLVHRRAGGENPAAELFTDPWLVSAGALWAAACAWALLR
ncbi:MAG: decaprenyl-phosphate phosphoribosyltransferase [Rhodospirillales bacterium]|nr:MAG: decaprenyl-phosphate phosphoribosyltransferase [Rhodospirillales bacterium]